MILIFSCILISLVTPKLIFKWLDLIKGSKVESKATSFSLSESLMPLQSLTLALLRRFIRSKCSSYWKWRSFIGDEKSSITASNSHRTSVSSPASFSKSESRKEERKRRLYRTSHQVFHKNECNTQTASSSPFYPIHSFVSITRSKEKHLEQPI